MKEPLASVQDLEGAWRPLTVREKTTAGHYLGAASRQIRRRWKTVDQRILDGELGAEDVSDVVVELVLDKLGGPQIRNARSWTAGAGPFQQQVTLQSGKKDLFDFEDWMLLVFESKSAVLPDFHAPPSGQYEGIFNWPEGRN
ncbi:Gp19/Gp15/Gp42 family protein [Arthrobacter glacialis]|uniref:Gp19/Gp15/Gp42 family protein n=1 Tax=Arthrobacter glacialis TaxID=1664 RepID=UPI000CD42C5D|nr:Gp19/Gp15/Gp42 family protein [Arthrobacter glacialis]POH58916.1 hypothetical protein CVS28_09415 [Arthrobacter glacialis]